MEILNIARLPGKCADGDMLEREAVSKPQEQMEQQDRKELNRILKEHMSPYWEREQD